MGTKKNQAGKRAIVNQSAAIYGNRSSASCGLGKVNLRTQG
jgi:hypothetical protein